MALSNYLNDLILSRSKVWTESTDRLLCYGIWILFGVYALAIVIDTYHFLKTANDYEYSMWLYFPAFIASALAPMADIRDLFISMPFFKNIDDSILYFASIGIFIASFYAAENIETDSELWDKR